MLSCEIWLAAAHIKSCKTNSYKDDPIWVCISLASIATGSNIHTLSVCIASHTVIAAVILYSLGVANLPTSQLGRLRGITCSLAVMMNMFNLCVCACVCGVGLSKCRYCKKTCSDYQLSKALISPLHPPPTTHVILCGKVTSMNI